VKARFQASGLLLNEDRRYVMSRGADSFKRGEKLSFANAVKPYDTRDGDGDVCLELRTGRSPQWAPASSCNRHHIGDDHAIKLQLIQ